MKNIAILTVVSCVLVQAFAFRIRPRLDGRIVGGEDADIADFPYQVSYQYYGSHICGGSIIGVRKILTAAHCTAAASTFISVRVGTSTVGSGGEVIQMSSIRQHPNYDADTTNYDVSVLTLNKDLSLGANVGIVALQPLGQLPEPGSPAVVTGWGALSEGGESSKQLQKVTVNHVPRHTCNISYNGAITPQMICYALPGKDSCQGDSGGPLVANANQVGIVSWGYGCARPKYQGVYTNIADAEINSFITR